MNTSKSEQTIEDTGPAATPRLAIASGRRRVKASSSVVILALLAAGCSGSAFDDRASTPLEDLTGGSLMSAVGLGEEDDRPPPDLRARAPLVLPPDENALPAPQESPIEADPANWPDDPDLRRQREAAARQAAGLDYSRRLDANKPQTQMTPEEIEAGRGEAARQRTAAVRERILLEKDQTFVSPDRLRAEGRQAYSVQQLKEQQARDPSRSLIAPPSEYLEPSENAALDEGEEDRTPVSENFRSRRWFRQGGRDY